MPLPFQLAIISDEIGQDFDRVCAVARELGADGIEPRGLWDKNLFNLDDAEVAEAARIVAKHGLAVAGLATPLFKVDWPGAPLSRYSPPRDEFRAGFGFEQQPEVLERAIELGRRLGAGVLRCFDFWRLADAAPFRAEMNRMLAEAAATAAAAGLALALENEFACNTATGAEAAAVLAAVPGLKLVWDPGNAVVAGEIAYPDGYRRLPAGRIGHMHCKDARPASGGHAGVGGWAWAPVGEGAVGWKEQLRALHRDGYRGCISLETHWRGGHSPEEATRRCWAGLQAALSAGVGTA